jgi:NAD(P)-dependent dehydrogenase (short-subunit alcohol dehydrogenase family)
MTLGNKVALVTGGSRGIGHAIATRIAAADAKTYITGRDAQALERAANQIGASHCVCDHCNEDEVIALMRSIREKDGRIDILINNAGAAHALAEVQDLDPTVWAKTIELNLTGTFLTTHYALPMMQSGAVIVNNLSIAAREVFTGMSAYCAAKAGALAFTNVLRNELRARGIRVMALISGATDTDIWKQFWADAPRHKMISPDTIAQMVLQAVTLPPEVSQDEIVILPSSGSL